MLGMIKATTLMARSISAMLQTSDAHAQVAALATHPGECKAAAVSHQPSMRTTAI